MQASGINVALITLFGNKKEKVLVSGALVSKNDSLNKELNTELNKTKENLDCKLDITMNLANFGTPNCNYILQIYNRLIGNIMADKK